MEYRSSRQWTCYNSSVRTFHEQGQGEQECMQQLPEIQCHHIMLGPFMLITHAEELHCGRGHPEVPLFPGSSLRIVRIYSWEPGNEVTKEVHQKAVN